LGNFQDAVEITKELAGIKGDVTLVYAKKRRVDVFDLLFDAGARFMTQVLRSLAGRAEYRWDGFSGLDIKGNY
jgi:hypothetical protein